MILLDFLQGMMDWSIKGGIVGGPGFNEGLNR